MDFASINLNFNPFEALTPSPEQELFWAGMEKQKEEIISAYQESIQFSHRKVVLNWGPVGGGKTHAAYFFEKSLPEEIEKDKILPSVYVRMPHEGRNANIFLIQNIFDSLTIRRAKEELERVLKEEGEKKLFEKIYGKIKSETFTEAIIFFGKETTPKHLLKRFIFDGFSASELKKLNIARSLKNDEDYTMFLAGIIIAITSSKDQKRLVLWVDEMENMVYYSSQQFKVVAQMFRDLIDRVNERLLVFFNFTLAENEEDTVRLLMGDALWSRVNKTIRFQNMSISEAEQYCKEAITFAQIKKEDYKPFNEESIKCILDTIPEIDLIPREINRKFDKVIRFALDQKIDKINKELVSKWIGHESLSSRDQQNED